MISYAIDTNALISFLTDRNIEQREIISDYIEKAGRLECEIFIVSNVVAELVYVLMSVYNLDPGAVHDIINAIHENPGLQVESWFNLESLLEYWPEKINEFGDAILAAYASELKIKILTFDRDFQKLLKKEGLLFQPL